MSDASGRAFIERNGLLKDACISGSKCHEELMARYNGKYSGYRAVTFWYGVPIAPTIDVLDDVVFVGVQTADAFEQEQRAVVWLALVRVKSVRWW